jgi:hypothetical protein
VREKIIATMSEIAAESGGQIRLDLTDASVLLQSGLDSLGFAVLVARLEEDLGYDPFTMMDEPVYPQTLGELVSIYERFATR